MLWPGRLDPPSGCPASSAFSTELPQEAIELLPVHESPAIDLLWGSRPVNPDSIQLAELFEGPEWILPLEHHNGELRIPKSPAFHLPRLLRDVLSILLRGYPERLEVHPTGMLQDCISWDRDRRALHDLSRERRPLVGDRLAAWTLAPAHPPFLDLPHARPPQRILKWKASFSSANATK